MATTPRAARILQLQLHQVRSYESLRLDLAGGTTALVGANGVGKTNLLEACAVVLSGASPRTSSELRLIREGCSEARIAARVRVGDDEHDRDVVLRAGRGKQLRVDAKPARSVDEYARDVPTATFLPERLLTIRGAPQRRRALLDQLAARLVPGAAATLRSYSDALAQRNAVLRQARAGRDVTDQLAPWTSQVIDHGRQLRTLRSSLLDLLADPYRDRFEQLTTLADASFTLTLRGSGDLEADFRELESAERRRGSTLAGPHLDDPLPRIDNRDVRAFGSAGEQRAALLAFTFAARDLLAANAGIEPVLLLDEPWSELDSRRRRRLTRMLEPIGQAIVTSTEAPSHLLDALPDSTVLQVSCGQVTACTTRPDPTD